MARDYTAYIRHFINFMNIFCFCPVRQPVKGAIKKLHNHYIAYKKALVKNFLQKLSFSTIWCIASVIFQILVRTKKFLYKSMVYCIRDILLYFTIPERTEQHAYARIRTHENARARTRTHEHAYARTRTHTHARERRGAGGLHSFLFCTFSPLRIRRGNSGETFGSRWRNLFR